MDGGRRSEINLFIPARRWLEGHFPLEQLIRTRAPSPLNERLA